MGWAIDLHSKLLQFYIPLLRHFLGGKRKNGELLSRPPFGEINLNLLFILNSWVTILGTTQAEFFGDLLVFSLAECKLTEHRLWSFCAVCRVFGHPVGASVRAEVQQIPVDWINKQTAISGAFVMCHMWNRMEGKAHSLSLRSF